MTVFQRLNQHQYKTKAIFLTQTLEFHLPRLIYILMAVYNFMTLSHIKEKGKKIGDKERINRKLNLQLNEHHVPGEVSTE